MRQPRMTVEPGIARSQDFILGAGALWWFVTMIESRGGHNTERSMVTQET
jgi:hypothetical protein